MSDYLEQLSGAVAAEFGCGCSYVRTDHVKLFLGSERVWSGKVEVFEVLSHPEASNAYAWMGRVGAFERPFAILGIAPIRNSAEAVKAAISSGRES